MATRRKGKPNPLKTWRATPEDQKLMNELQAKLGVSESNLLRLGLRKLAQAEGVSQQ